MPNSLIITTDIYELALDQAYNSVVVTDRSALIVYANPAFCNMTGYSRDELLGQSPKILQGPNTDQAVIDELRKCLATGRYFEGQTVNYRKDGVAYYVRWNISPIRDQNGIITHFVSVQNNISDSIKQLQFRNLLLNSIGDGVYCIDNKGCFTHMNPAACALLGFDNEQQVIGKPSHATIHYQKINGEPFPEHECEIHRVIQNGDTVKMWRDVFYRTDGQAVTLSVTASPLVSYADEIDGAVVVLRDVSAYVIAEQALNEKANVDLLTGAYNRYFFEQYMQDVATSKTSHSLPMSLLTFDIDHFKHVNDTYGHQIGDDILAQLCEIVRQEIRSSDVLVRWGGEEFLLVLPHSDQASGLQVAEKIRYRIAQHRFSLHQLLVTVSVGVAVLNNVEQLGETLKYADDALYKAKYDGRNRVCVAKLNN